jgi:hypothetical protein
MMSQVSWPTRTTTSAMDPGLIPGPSCNAITAVIALWPYLQHA